MFIVQYLISNIKCSSVDLLEILATQDHAPYCTYDKLFVNYTFCHLNILCK